MKAIATVNHKGKQVYIDSDEHLIKFILVVIWVKIWMELPDRIMKRY